MRLEATVDADTIKAISGGVFALLGAGIGSTTTFLVQHRGVRLEREKLTHTVRGRVNALSVSVFREFLSASKIVERLAERLASGEMIADAEVYAATNTMWLRWQEISVFCDPRISYEGRCFVDKLQTIVWNPSDSETVGDQLEVSRAKLFSVAGPVFREAEF